MGNLKFCPLFSGSNGNSIFVCCNKVKVLFDCGGNFKKIKENMAFIGENVFDLDAVFITHYHTDHSAALPLILKNTDAKICATVETLGEIFYKSKKMNELFEFYRTRIFQIREKQRVNLRDFYVSAFSVPHDAPGTVGYNLISEDKKISILTDIGFLRKNLYEDVLGEDLVFIESNHDVICLQNCNYPPDLKQRILSDGGHLSNENCGKFVSWLVSEKKVKRVVLGHLSGEANTSKLALKTVKNILADNGIVVNKDVEVWVSPRGELGRTVVL